MYLIREVYDRIGIKQCDVLNLIEMWDGGSTEAHLSICKNSGKYIICEEMHNFNSKSNTKFEHALTNTNNLDSIVLEIESFCKNRYKGTLQFDFRKLLDYEDAAHFFDL